jgi:hypothetical protein
MLVNFDRKDGSGGDRKVVRKFFFKKRIILYKCSGWNNNGIIFSHTIRVMAFCHGLPVTFGWGYL